MTSRQDEIRRYIDAFVAHLLEQERILFDGGSAIIGNQHADAYVRAQEELFAKYGDDGREAFSCLLDHEDPAVRGEAAAVLLRYRHDKAMEVLKDLARRNDLGLVCAGAQATIARWEEGTWNLDPPSQPASDLTSWDCS